MKRITVKTLMLSLAVAGMSGCAIQTPGIKTEINTHSSQAEKIKKAVDNNGLQINDGFAPQIDDGLWVSTQYQKSSSLLPDAITQTKYTFIQKDGLTLAELSTFITEKTGIRVTRADELIDHSRPNSMPMGYPQPGTESSSNTSDDRFIPTGRYVPNVHRAPLKTLLDNIAVTMGISWRYNEKKGITFYYYDTKTFYVHATSGDFSANTIIKNDSKSGGDEGASGDSNQTSKIEIKPRIWEQLEKSLEKIVTKNGHLIINRATGAVTINDNDRVINQVGDYVKELNRLLAMQVHMRLMMITLKVDQSDLLSLSYDLVYNAADGVINFGTARSGATGLSGIGGKVTNPNSRWNGSKLFLDALSTRGDVTDVSTSDILIGNYRPYHYRSGGTIRYIGNVSTTNTPDVGTSESVEVDELFSGLGIIFLPNIFNKKQLTMDMNISQQELNQFDLVELTNTTIKLPDTSNQDLSNSYTMRDGEVRVLAAFERKRHNTDNSGTLSPDNIWLGGTQQAEGKRELMVIVGTPHII